MSFEALAKKEAVYCGTPHRQFTIAGWSSLVARQAHNLKVRGSNPLPATTFKAEELFLGLFLSILLAMNILVHRNYYVYVLWSDTGLCFYKGVTDNIPHRLTQHNNGESKWTKRYAGSWRLVWQREFPSLGEARKFENRLKRQKGGIGFWKLTGLNPSHFTDSSGS